MKRILLFTLTICCVTGVFAGDTPGSHGEDDLQPGDSSKPVIVNLLPGGSDDPYKIDDPIIIIVDDGPSEDDSGVVYCSGRSLIKVRSVQFETHNE